MPKITSKEQKVVQSPEFVLTTKLINEFRQLWIDQMKESGVSQVLYSRLSLVALTQVAAIAGVDVGMSVEQFTDVCRANFEQAYDRAPKFGA